MMGIREGFQWLIHYEVIGEASLWALTSGYHIRMTLGVLGDEDH